MTQKKLNLVSNPLGSFDNSIEEKARDFATEHLTQYAESWEKNGFYPKEAIKTASKDLGGFLISKELGGKGGSVTEFLIMVEELAKVDIAFTLAFIVHSNVAFIISQSPNQELRNRLLPKLISGERIGAFCLTEPEAGSDATGIQTVAQQNDHEALLFGTKAWVTAGGCADDLVVFAKTSKDGNAKTVAAYAIDAHGNGVKRGTPYNLISGHLAQVSDITFEGVSAHESDILFEEGTAFSAAMSCLDAARLGIAAMCNGALTSALGVSLEYADNRKMFGGTTLDFQGIQWNYAEHLTQLEASRTLMFQTAALAESGKPFTLASAHAKKLANQVASEGIPWAIRAMGAAGTRREYPLARQFGHLQLLFNTDGTPEIMNVLIGRSLKA